MKNKDQVIELLLQMMIAREQIDLQAAKAKGKLTDCMGKILKGGVK